MSGRHVGIVFRYSTHAGGELLVLVCIAEALNDKTGTWYMSVSQIATRCKLSDRQVFRILPKLRESNELGMRKGGPQGQNVFWLKLQPPILTADVVSGEVLTMTPATEAKEELRVAGVTAMSLPLQQVPASHMASASDLKSVGFGPCISTQLHADDLDDATVTAEVTTSTDGHDIPVRPSMTPVTPITRHSEKITTSPGADPNGIDSAEEVARLLREGGVERIKVTKEFREAVNLGATAATLLGAIAESAHAGNPFAYGVTRILNSLRAAGRPAVKFAATSMPVVSSVAYTEDPALQKIKREASLAVPVPAFVRELSRKLRNGAS